MNRICGITLVCLALGTPLFCGAAEKARVLPKDLPPYGPLKPFAAPQVKVGTLSNGLTLWLVPRRGFPEVAFAVAVRGGTASDPKDRPGLAELLVATLDQGTKTRNAQQIAEDIQAAGGDLYGLARADALTVSTQVLATKSEAALSLLADIVQNATFPDGEVDLAKRKAADRLKEQEAEPSFLAQRALAKAVFGAHPYSVVSPTQGSIASTNPQDLRQEYARRFRPDQTLLVAVGDFDSESLRAAVTKLFANWQVPREATIPPLPRPPSENARGVLYVERPHSVQTTFALGAFAPTERDEDFAAAEVANAIYGGMFGSRLVNNIREDKGYTYSPGAFLQSRREAGLVQTSADVRNEVTGATFNEIGYELNRMATTSPAQEEVEHARRYLIGVKALELQAHHAVARRLASLWTYGLAAEKLGQETEKIQKVTAQDVEAVGRKYFPASRQTVVTVGEEKVIREQLAPFGVPINRAPM